MKTVLPLCVMLVGFFASVAQASADVSVVNTSNALHIASVNELEDEAPWYALQQAFCTSFTEQLPSIGGRVMPLKIHVRDSVEAAEALRNGTCDAVMVMGEVLPISLRNKSFIAVKASSQSGAGVRIFHFILRKDDRALVSTLLPVFERATSSANFQDSVKNASSSHVLASK